MMDKERATRMNRSQFRHLFFAAAWSLAILFMPGRTILAGDYAADFLHVGIGARPMAMGGAYVAIANDASATYWNPAGWSGNTRFSVQLEHVPMFSGLAQYNSMSAHLAFDGATSISLNWIRLGIDEIPRYGELVGNRYDRLTLGQNRSTGEPLGYFADQEDAIMLSFRRSVILDLVMGGGFSGMLVPTEFSIGITGKYLYQKLDHYAGSGQGIDAGFLIRFMPNWNDEPEPLTWLSFGAVVRDLARTQLSWNTDSRHKDEIERGLQAGVAASKLFSDWRTRLTMSYDYSLWTSSGHYAGAELEFLRTVCLRSGYYRDHFTAGAGLRFRGFSVDYAFISGELDNTHRVSGAFAF
jgi:hypothetical protein